VKIFSGRKEKRKKKPADEVKKKNITGERL
jgi:hypothetical protein